MYIMLASLNISFLRKYEEMVIYRFYERFSRLHLLCSICSAFLTEKATTPTSLSAEKVHCFRRDRFVDDP